jgi:hypothetical protein
MISGNLYTGAYGGILAEDRPPGPINKKWPPALRDVLPGGNAALVPKWHFDHVTYLSWTEMR